MTRLLYLATVVVVVGFTQDSAAVVLTAAALTLPAGVVAAPAYYVV